METDRSPGPPPASVAVGGAPLPTDALASPMVRLRWQPIWLVLGAALLLVAALIGAAGIMRAPYVVFAPGDAIDTEPAISTPGTESYESDGELLFLTVSLRGATRRVGYVEAMVGWLSGDSDVLPRQAIIGDRTGEENREQSLQMMVGSQQLAAKVALEHLGYEVTSTGTGAVILGTVPDAPVADVVEAGDVIVGVDGSPIDLDEELRAALEGKAAGDEVGLELERTGEGEAETVTVTTELITDPDDPGRVVLGVSVATRDLGYDLPFTVEIDTKDVGGPSAGLALTLGLLDHLTEGSLTGGADVAVTGTIQPDGTVGEVGGVGQKAVAAADAGATLMLVPEPEVAEARRLAPDDLSVVGVADLDDALEALAAVGGNADELPRDGGG